MASRSPRATVGLGWPVVALAAALLSARGPSLAQPQPAPVPRPRLLLFVSVDQMRADYLERFASLYGGGLRRLLDDGAVFGNARYRHANNETGPGHAVLLSGRDPRSSGIIANDWYDTTLGRPVNVVEDPVQRPVGGLGRGASPASFVGFTVGDVLKGVSPDSRVVAVSMKDRSAVLMGGRRADAAYWFEAREGRFVTSTYYMKTAPAWLVAWNDRRLVDGLSARTWTRLLPDEGLYRRLAGEDAFKSEWDGRETAFPHAVAAGLGRSPFADELTLDFALEAIDAHGLGRRDALDVVAIGFSATDGVGHTYGPDSHEQMDNLLRLDLTLGRLFAALDERVGRGGWLLGLSADHGVLPLVEKLQEQGVPARRVHPQSVAAAVDKALAARFPGAPDLVAHRDGADVYLDLAAIERRGLRRSAVESAVEEGLLATGIVERVYTHARLAGDAPADDAAFPLFRNAFFAPRSPHLIARVKPYVYLSSYPGGTGHGTYHDYDRHVPVVFMGPGVKPGRYPAECGPEDIAPTLAALLGLDYPLQDAKRVLSEAFLP